MVFKGVVGVTIMLAQFFVCDCIFPGDSCVANQRPGVCKLLAECQPLVTEIQNAGAPMPSRIRMKLQGLACGFQAHEPLVCCVTPYTNNILDPIPTHPDFPLNHGLGVPFFPTPDRHTTHYPWDLDPTEPNRNDNIDTPVTRSPNSNTLINKFPPAIERHRNIGLLPRKCGPFSDDFRIWGGNRTFLYEMPWMVLIAYHSPRGLKLSCGGTLITERYVLTAAHCVSFLGNRLTLSGVVLGEYDTRQDPDCERSEGELHCAPNVRNVSIETVIPHPGYSPQNLYDDIALIRLAEPADFSLDNMKPICLPDTSELLRSTLEGQMGTVAGWGATEEGINSPVLLKVDLPIISNKECQEAYSGTPRIYDRQMCAGGVEEKDSCGGDSGGPLMSTGRVRSGSLAIVQQGIVSYGSRRCGIGGFPGVYTRVSHYMDWILDNISE